VLSELTVCRISHGSGAMLRYFHALGDFLSCSASCSAVSLGIVLGLFVADFMSWETQHKSRNPAYGIIRPFTACNDILFHAIFTPRELVNPLCRPPCCTMHQLKENHWQRLTAEGPYPLFHLQWNLQKNA
jgi:hypothetical protein